VLRTGQWSGEDRLVPTPKCFSCSRVLDLSVVSTGLTADVLDSPLVCQSTNRCAKDCEWKSRRLAFGDCE